MEIKRILYTTDFGKGAVKSAEAAADLAKRYSAKLHVLHIIYDVAHDSWLYRRRIKTAEIYRELQESVTRELESFVSDNFKGVDVTFEVIVGLPHKDIVRVAREMKSDLIVIGSHGRKGIGRVIFGSTAMQVLRQAPCAVFTVRLLPQPTLPGRKTDRKKR